jgi:hypothetical protein
MQTQIDAQRRKSQRDRTRKHRAKVKAESANTLAATEQRTAYTLDEFNAWRVRLNLVFPGERAPFTDAEVCGDALTVAREFLIALNEPDVQFEESLLKVERRVVKAWCEAGCPLLNRDTRRLETSVADTTGIYLYDFDQKWVPLEGADLPIDISTLPVIVVPELVEVPAVYTPPIVEVAPTIEDNITPTIEAAIMKAQQREELASR